MNEYFTPNTAWFIKGDHQFYWHRKGKIVKIPVLDHGYVEFIEAWGHGKVHAPQLKELDEGKGECGYDMECGIIEAARQSTQGSFRGWGPIQCIDEGCPQWGTDHEHTGDERLLKYLYENQHSTPFEFAGMVIEVQAPIFVFREWHRHRTQSYNEMSARYEPLPDLYYVPERITTVDRVWKAAKEANKQASSSNPVNSLPIAKEITDGWLEALEQAYSGAEMVYQAALKGGIPKELARLIMPVGHYSRMRASANLRNWLSFMTLRCDHKAQWETRQFALAVQSIVEKVFPRTWGLWAAGL